MLPTPVRGLRGGLLVATTVVVASCGGDTASTSVALSGPPAVTGALMGFPASAGVAEPTNNATVAVMDVSNGETPIPVASVAINGTSLHYNGTSGRYEGHVTVNAGEVVSLTVQVGSLSYTANATQFRVYPVLTAPQAAQTISSSQTLSIAWQGSTPAPDGGYLVSVLDATQPDADPLWPVNAGSGLPLPSATTSYDVPGTTIPAGQRLVLVGAVQEVTVPGAAGGSTFALGAYDIVPLTVSGLPLTRRTSTTQQQLNGVAWSGAQFVAVGNAGTILTSPEGSTWTAQVSAIPRTLLGVVWSRSQWVVVGDNGTILTSPDGISWTIQTSGTNAYFYSVADSGSKYLAVGFQSIYSSPDGRKWTSQVSGTQDVLQGVACSPARCVVVGRAGNILSSEDGVTWTPRVVPAAFQNTGYEGVTWTGTQFVAAGFGEIVCCSDSFATSSDGLSWTVTNPNTNGLPYAVAFSGSTYLAVGGSGVAGTILSSTDAATWTPEATGAPFAFLGVASSGSRFVAVGGGGEIYTSP
jgi:hypothetical protein